MSQFDHRPRIEDLALTRRELMHKLGNGVAMLGLASVMGTEGVLAHAEESRGAVSLNPLAVKHPPLPARAKRVIHIFANGGPSHVDTFDPKPMLTKHHGEPLPYSNLPTERRTGACYKSPYEFKKYGRSGIEISEIFPNVATCADDLCVIRSMHADIPNHEPSLLLMNCGEGRLIRPAMGSWITYGLGSENQNLPGFIVMCPRGYPIQETQNWQSGFLPGVFQGMYIDPAKASLPEMIEHIQNNFTPLEEQRKQLDLLRKLNQAHMERRQNDAQLEAKIQSYEMAYRMQMDATDAFDIDREPQYIKEMYGIGSGVYAKQTLIARRLLERGVRFIQLYHGEGQPWDNHDDIEVNHRKLATECDKPIAALIKDLKQRGMLEDTLIVWGGEFGRTPTVELPTPGANAGKTNGRDHNHHGFSMWMAGGGVNAGHVHGATDDFGFKAEVDKVHVHDLHATMLKLLGFDHTKLTFKYAGRDFRLTDVYGEVIPDLIA
jgi:hypothetical protein